MTYDKEVCTFLYAPNAAKIRVAFFISKFIKVWNFIKAAQKSYRMGRTDCVGDEF